MSEAAKRRVFSEDTIFRVSLGVLVIMAIGLITGTGYAVNFGVVQARQEKDISDLQAKQTDLETLKTDMALVKASVKRIEQGQIAVMNRLMKGD